MAATHVWRAGTGGLRILELEDSAEDAEIIFHALKSQGLNCHVTRVADTGAFEELLAREPFDLILCDHCVVGINCIEALEFARKIHPETPLIMLSGAYQEGEEEEALKAGASSCILKSELEKLGPGVRRALGQLHDEDGKALKVEAAGAPASLLHLAAEALVIRTVADRITFWNHGAQELFGWSGEEASGKAMGLLLGVEEEAWKEAQRQLRVNGSWQGELTARDKAGRQKQIFSRWSLRREPGGPVYIVSAATDITERRKIEAALLRAQRMESIGALASGIVHDLNNCLAPVLVGVDLLRTCTDERARTEFLEVASSGVKRAVGMAQQILRFARGRNEREAPMPLERVVREIVKLMRETFPKSIVIVHRGPEEGLWNVRADGTEVHQALLNLCVNARDAMPAGGRLEIAAENVTLESNEAENVGASAGKYVRLSVADTGEGIPREVLPHIFEPFFTTKAPERGTGLGLSTVKHIVRQHGGCIEVESEPGRGSRFTALLPAIELEPAPEPARAADLPRGNYELILFLDDEAAACQMARTLLEGHGYRVICAPDGRTGLALFGEYERLIRLVISDADMPLVNGLDVLQAVTRARPEVPVLLVSGSRHDTEFLRKRMEKVPRRLQKPYTAEEFLRSVHHALETSLIAAGAF